jgi:PAS domain S-box-containing protein
MIPDELGAGSNSREFIDPSVAQGPHVSSIENGDRTLATVFDAIEHAIVIVDVLETGEFRYVGQNLAHEQLTGIPTHNLIGKSPEQVLSSSAAAAVRRHYKDCLSRGAAVDYEECLFFQGDQTWWMTRLTPLRDAQSRIYRLISSSVNITERKQVEEALRQRVERERLVGSITQHLRQSLDLRKVLSTTVNEIHQLIQADRVLIYQLEPDLSGTIVVEALAAGWVSLLNRRIIDPCFTQTHIYDFRRGVAKAKADIYEANAHPCYTKLLAQFQVRAAMIVPILEDEHLWGLLIVHHCASPRQWQTWEITLLQQLAIQVGIAIQQSQLYQRVQQLNSRLEKLVNDRTIKLQEALNFEALLKRITDKVRDSLDENQILQSAVEELTLLSVVDCCTASIYNLDQKISTIRYEHRLSSCTFRKQVLPMGTCSEVYDQLLNGQYFQFCPLTPKLDLGYVAIFACPVMDDQHVLGDLWLVKPKEYGFDDLEIRLVQQVANQCAIALRQSKLYQLAQAQVQELEQINYLKDSFLDYISHTLRSPMGNITLATEMLEISLKELGLLEDPLSPINRYFSILKQECYQEVDLINKLLDLAYLQEFSSEQLNDELN